MYRSSRDQNTATAPKLGVAVVGNSEDIGTWSGIPYHLLEAGRNRGFLAGGLDLKLENFDTRRSIWQASRLLRLQRPRGFQYSPSFLDQLAKRAIAECARMNLQEVISHWQLLPARLLLGHSVRTSFYIDTTLLDLFETHGMYTWLNRTIAEEALEREMAEYHAAARVVTMASWATESILNHYGVPKERVHTVLAGANLPEDQVQQRLSKSGPAKVPDSFTENRPLRLGFTGKDWQRKGLMRLVGAAEILNRTGIPTRVLVVGNLPDEYRNHRYVVHAGFIDKATDASRFMEAVGDCDLGCAPSHEEPMGIAPLEYLRLGVPVLCTAAGGLTDVCAAAGAASILLGKDVNPEEIAGELEVLARNPERLQSMRAAAWRRKEYFSWDRTVNELQRIWGELGQDSTSRIALCRTW